MQVALIYYKTETEKEGWINRLLYRADQKLLGVVTGNLPILGNLTVFENIMLPASYHYGLNQKEGRKMVLSDLEKYGLEKFIDSRPDKLDDFQKFLVKYLQAVYLQSKWIVIISPRKMYAAEYDGAFKEFFSYEIRDNSVIIDHINNKNFFQDFQNYTELDFESWLETNF